MSEPSWKPRISMLVSSSSASPLRVKLTESARLLKPAIVTLAMSRTSAVVPSVVKVSPSSSMITLVTFSPSTIKPLDSEAKLISVNCESRTFALSPLT